MKKSIVVLLFLTISCLAYSQEVKTSVVSDSLQIPTTLQSHSSSLNTDEIDPSLINFSPSAYLRFPSQAAINPDATKFTIKQPYLYGWDGGMMTGFSQGTSNFSSVVNVSGINVLQYWGNLSMNGSVYLSKGLYNGIGMANGFGADLGIGYRLSDNVSLHAIGGIVSFGYLGPLSNATGAYYGGYVSLLTNNHKWGLDVGVRRVYNNFSGRWETIPITMPYYNLNGAKIGIDVGGLVYGIFSGAAKSSFKKSSVNSDARRGPAIIAPPIDVTPHFDPIETPNWVEKQY